MKLPELPRSVRAACRRGPGPGGTGQAPVAGQVFRPGYAHLVFVLVAGAALALCVVAVPTRVLPPYVPGQLADRTLYSEQAFSYEDPEQTRLRQDEAARREPPVFTIEAAAVTEAREALAQAGRLLAGEPPAGEAAGGATAAGAARATSVLQDLDSAVRRPLEPLALIPGRWSFLERRLAEWLATGLASDAELETRFDGIALQYDSIQVVDPAGRRFRRGLAELQSPRRLARQAADELASNYPDSAGAEAALGVLLPRLLPPNLRFDAALTQASRDRARAQVEPVRCEVAPGDLLLRRGQPVTRGDLVRLEQYRQLEEVRESWRDRLVHQAAVVLVFLLALGCGLFMLHAVHAEAVVGMPHLLVVGVVLVGQILLNRVSGGFFYRHFHASPVLLPALLPLGLGALLLGPLIGLRAAVWAGLLGSLAAALCFPDPLALLVTGTLVSFMAAVLMRRARRRYHALRTGVGVGAAQAVLCCAFLVQARVPLELAWHAAAASFLNGVFCAVTALLVTPAFEYLFGLTTDHALLELGDLNHPLLKRLQLEAPGTYHHSLLVAALAEEAAAAIGANPLLARVCAYFHDIGKLASPEYFTENAMGADPHAALDPRASSQLILRHVTYGLELAAKHKLKPAIREAVSQHHGTMRIACFYQKALTAPGAERQAPVEAEFRYPGPLPGRREIVVVGLADCCEAAARSLENPTAERVRQLVHDLVRQRFEDGQLADADISLRELFVVRDTIARTLANMLHGRVSYPRERTQGENHTVQDRPHADHPGPGRPAAVADEAGRLERGRGGA